MKIENIDLYRRANMRIGKLREVRDIEQLKKISNSEKSKNLQFGKFQEFGI